MLITTRRRLVRVSGVATLMLCLLFCGCANWLAQVNHNYDIRRIEHQNGSYYAELAKGCDVFLKLNQLEPNALYISDATNIAKSHLPSIITDLKPDQIIYTVNSVSIGLGKNSWIGWNRDKTQTNVWKMTISYHGKEKTVYEEQSTKCSFVSFGLFDRDNNLLPTNQIPYGLGIMYGWKLSVYSREDKVRVKEVFELPGGAKWTEGAVPDGIETVSDQISPSGNRRVLEFDLAIKKGSSETEVDMPYRIAKGDPKGTHKISIFLNGQLIKDFTFQIVDK